MNSWVPSLFEKVLENEKFIILTKFVAARLPLTTIYEVIWSRITERDLVGIIDHIAYV